MPGSSPFARRYLGNLWFDLFSSRYLDVSVPKVRFVILFIQITITHKCVGFPHSDISGSQVTCHLPEAFRRLSRLSSPLTAKASSVCAFFFDHIIQLSQRFVLKFFTSSLSSLSFGHVLFVHSLASLVSVSSKIPALCVAFLLDII